MTPRFTLPDDLGETLLDRAYDLTVRMTRIGNECCASFKLEGSLSLEQPEPEDGDTDEMVRDEVDVKLLRRLLARFQETAKSDSPD